MEAFWQPFFSDVPNVRNKYLKSKKRRYSAIRFGEKGDIVIGNIKG